MNETKPIPQATVEEDVIDTKYRMAGESLIATDEANVPAKMSIQDPSSSPSKPSRFTSSPSKSNISPSLQSPIPSHGIVDLSSPAPSPSKRVSASPSLTSSRPAPASPASSRPPSALFDPSSSSFGRDRSTSTSSRGGRRVSNSSAVSISNSRKPRPGSRASSKPRPKSTLGINIILPESNTPSSTGKEPESRQSQNSIPENISEPSAEISQSHLAQLSDFFQMVLPEVTIRDFAFDLNDERFHGRGVIEEGDTNDSGGYKWLRGKDDYGESSTNGSGWGGFGFLGGWRNKPIIFTGDEDGRPTFDDEDSDEGDFEPAQQEVEEYYSSPAQSDSGETFGYSYNILEPLPENIEPKGYYRAAYPFEALSSSEMTLEEGDLISLSGRGNGDPGWVIARRVRVLAGKIAGIDEVVGLVPESYLERVEVIED